MATRVFALNGTACGSACARRARDFRRFGSAPSSNLVSSRRQPRGHGTPGACAPHATRGTPRASAASSASSWSSQRGSRQADPRASNHAVSTSAPSGSSSTWPSKPTRTPRFSRITRSCAPRDAARERQTSDERRRRTSRRSSAVVTTEPSRFLVRRQRCRCPLGRGPLVVRRQALRPRPLVHRRRSPWHRAGS